jgi:hypothetical protein
MAASLLNDRYGEATLARHYGWPALAGGGGGGT